MYLLWKRLSRLSGRTRSHFSFTHTQHTLGQRTNSSPLRNSHYQGHGTLHYWPIQVVGIVDWESILQQIQARTSLVYYMFPITDFFRVQISHLVCSIQQTYTEPKWFHDTHFPSISSSRSTVLTFDSKVTFENHSKHSFAKLSPRKLLKEGNLSQTTKGQTLSRFILFSHSFADNQCYSRSI